MKCLLQAHAQDPVNKQDGDGMIGVRRFFYKRLYNTFLKKQRMVFECQKDSYKSEFTTKVVSCKEIGLNEYEIVLEDTILFPEGGGQVSYVMMYKYYIEYYMNIIMRFFLFVV